MNEKFKKDEVWGSLVKATTKIEGVDDNASPIGDREVHGMIPNPKVGLGNWNVSILIRICCSGLFNGKYLSCGACGFWQCISIFELECKLLFLFFLAVCIQER